MHQLHKIVHRAFGFIDDPKQSVAQFSQVVRRNVGGHAHGNARRTVEQQVGNLGGQYRGLLLRSIIIGAEVHGLFVDISQKFRSQTRHADFGVTHGGRGVAVNGPEVPLAVFQGIAHVEFLSQAHQGIVYGHIAVRMIFADDVAYHAGALLVRSTVGVGQLRLGVQNTPMHGFEAVTGVGDGSAYDNAEGIGKIGLPEFLFDVDIRMNFQFGHGISFCDDLRADRDSEAAVGRLKLFQGFQQRTGGRNF